MAFDRPVYTVNNQTLDGETLEGAKAFEQDQDTIRTLHKPIFVLPVPLESVPALKVTHISLNTQ